MTIWRTLLAAALVGAPGALSTANVRSVAATPGGFCSRVSPGVVAGTIAAPDLVELSGLAASHTFPGVLWANNDSGDAPRLFAMTDTGASLGTFTVAGADAVDWEDIATGPGPDPARSYVYVGDIGDNAAARDHVTVYRVPEPDVAPSGPDGVLEGADRFDLVYPGGAEDAEALLVDPRSGDLIIITKQLSGQSRVLAVAAADLLPERPTVMTAIGSISVAATPAYDPTQPLALPSTMVTAADIAPDGGTILVRTYEQVLAYDREAGQTIGAALAGVACAAAQVGEPQGEAIAFSNNGDRYFTAGEVQLAIAQGAVATGDSNRLSAFAIAPPPESDPGTTVQATVTTTDGTRLGSSIVDPAPVGPPATVVTTPASITTGITPAISTGEALTTGTGSRSSRGSSPDRAWLWAVVVGGAVLLGGVIAVRAARRRPRA